LFSLLRDGDSYQLGQEERFKQKSPRGDSNKPAVAEKDEGTHIYLNDVWYSDGFAWDKYHGIERDEYTEHNLRYPHRDGQMSWTQQQPGKVPPPSMTWDDWVQCDLAPWQPTPPGVDCMNIFQPPGSYTPVPDAIPGFIYHEHVPHK